MSWHGDDYYLWGTVQCETCGEMGLRDDEVYGDGDCNHCYQMKTDAAYKTAYLEKKAKKEEETRLWREKVKKQIEYRKQLTESLEFPFSQIDKAFFEDRFQVVEKVESEGYRFNFDRTLRVMPSLVDEEETEVEVSTYGVKDYERSWLTVYVTVRVNETDYLDLIRNPDKLKEVLQIHTHERVKLS